MRLEYRRGFTIPELIITLGIVAIILTAAVPSISNTIKDNRLAASVNSVIADVYYARSEAAKRHVRVILCRSKAPNSSGPTCDTATATDDIWTGGYLVFADDGSGANSVYDAGSDVLLRRGQPASSGVEMLTSAAWNRNLEFNPNGSTHENGATAVMSLCDDRGKARGRQVVVSPSGVPVLHSGDISTCSP